MSVLVSRFRHKRKGLCLVLSQVNKEVMESLTEVMRRNGHLIYVIWGKVVLGGKPFPRNTRVRGFGEIKVGRVS